MRPNPFGEPLPRVVDGEVVEPPVESPVESQPDHPVPRPRVQRPATTEPEPGPRVAVLSLREVRPLGDYGGLHEAEDALVDTLSAGLYRVVLASPKFARPPFDKAGVRRALNASRVVQPYRIEHRQQHGNTADVLIVLARDLADAAALVGVPGWHELAEQVVMHVAVVTERDLRRHPDLVQQLRRRVDALFSGTEMPPLGFLHSDRLRTVEVMPPLLDVLAFPARPEQERTIDVFSPGSRPPGQHDLLRHWASSARGRYQQDIGQLGAITSHDQHRRIFTTMATRSRLLLTNFDRFDRRRHAGAHREVGGRFYDAMAAGCALVGDLPTSSRQFGEYVAAAAPLPFPADAQQLPSDVADALADPAESRRLGDVARAAALRHNDAAHRWRAMAALAGIPESPGIAARIDQLAALADQLNVPGTEPGTEEQPSSAGSTGSADSGDLDAAVDRP